MNYDPNRIHHMTYAEITQMVKELRERITELTAELERIQRELGNRNV